MSSAYGLQMLQDLRLDIAMTHRMVCRYVHGSLTRSCDKSSTGAGSTTEPESPACGVVGYWRMLLRGCKSKHFLPAKPVSTGP